MVLVAVLGGCGAARNQWAENFSHPADAPPELPLWADTPVNIVRVPADGDHRVHVAPVAVNVEYLGESQLYMEEQPSLEDQDLSKFAKSIGADTVGLAFGLQTSTVDAGRTFWTGAAWSKNVNTYSVIATYWHTVGVR